MEINNSLIYDIFQINKDSFLNAHHLSLMDEKQTKELNFLQRKRENDHLEQRINNNFIFQKENFTIQKNDSGNVRNESQSYLINFGVNSCKKSFGESLDNLDQKQNNKINIIAGEKKTNLINMSFKRNNSSQRIRYFNIIKNNGKCSFGLNNNNEIKVLKNKKAVYINKYSTSRALNKLRQFKFLIQKKQVVNIEESLRMVINGKY